MTYKIHAAAIDTDGLLLSGEPRAETLTLREALRLSQNVSNHGPEGAAIVCPGGTIIYSADEYARAENVLASELTADYG